MHGYEEHKEWNTLWSWLFIILLSGGLIGWAMFMMTVVKDVEREWDYGSIPFTPAISVYSTEIHKEKPEERMIEPLPEGISIEESQNQQMDKNPSEND